MLLQSSWLKGGANQVGFWVQRIVPVAFSEVSRGKSVDVLLSCVSDGVDGRDRTEALARRLRWWVKSMEMWNMEGIISCMG